MKKKLAGLLAALLVLTMGTTVFGAGSPTAEDIKQAAASAAASANVGAAVDSENTPITVSRTTLTNDQYSAAVDQVETGEKLLAAMELTAPDNTKFPITVTLKVTGITSTDSVNNIRILHLGASGWETLTPTSVAEGSVTVTLTSLSPVAVVRTTATNTGGSDADNTATDTNPSNTYNTYNTYNYAGNNKPDTLSQTNGSNTSTPRTGDSSSGGNTQTNNNYQTVNVYPTGNGTSTSAQTSASTSTTSPKTGASLPAFPIIAILAVMGIAVCGKKARSLS